MIVPHRRTWLSLMVSWRGSVLTATWRRVSFVTVVACGVTYAYQHGDIRFDLTALPFSLVGFALSIFLGFRNNTSYDRFWEGRKLWGRVVNTSRSLTRQVLTLVRDGDAPSAEHRALVLRLAGYVHALRLHLRGERDLTELAPFLEPGEPERLLRESNPPIALLQSLGDRFSAHWRAGRVDPFHLPVLEDSLTQLADIQGGCERIRATPIPFGYTVLMHRIVGLYCFGLPFGIVSQVGLLTPVVVFLISYAFFGLDALGDEIEDPFGTDANDLPLSQLSRMIEINLRERLGETDLPEPVRPRNGTLT